MGRIQICGYPEITEYPFAGAGVVYFILFLYECNKFFLGIFFSAS
jgi:hypothetical protein